MHKLDAFTEPHRAAQQKVRQLIWNFYADLKAYKANPDKRRRVVLRARFDSIFRRRTGFATLDRLLARLHANEAELLMVLERPKSRCIPMFRERYPLSGHSPQGQRRDAQRSGAGLP